MSKPVHNFKNWLNCRSGRLLVVEHLGKNEKDKQHMWKAICDCGKEKIVKSRELNAGDTKSCGCLYQESIEKATKNFTEKYKTHGWAGTSEYKAWKRIKGRTCNPNNLEYSVYSLLGMEESWKLDFIGFLDEIGVMPKDGQRWSVGRIDNTLGYFKGNVRWELDSQQAKNKGKYKNNSSGETGVYWNIVKNQKGVSTTFAVATWYDLDGNPKARSFSTKKYGLLESFALAVDLRRKKIAELIEAGVEYGEHHGK